MSRGRAGPAGPAGRGATPTRSAPSVACRGRNAEGPPARYAASPATSAPRAAAASGARTTWGDSAAREERHPGRHRRRVDARVAVGPEIDPAGGREEPEGLAGARGEGRAALAGGLGEEGVERLRRRLDVLPVIGEAGEAHRQGQRVRGAPDADGAVGARTKALGEGGGDVRQVAQEALPGEGRDPVGGADEDVGSAVRLDGLPVGGGGEVRRGAAQAGVHPRAGGGERLDDLAERRFVVALPAVPDAQDALQGAVRGDAAGGPLEAVGGVHRGGEGAGRLGHRLHPLKDQGIGAIALREEGRHLWEVAAGYGGARLAEEGGHVGQETRVHADVSVGRDAPRAAGEALLLLGGGEVGGQAQGEVRLVRGGAHQHGLRIEERPCRAVGPRRQRRDAHLVGAECLAQGGQLVGGPHIVGGVPLEKERRGHAVLGGEDDARRRLGDL